MGEREAGRQIDRHTHRQREIASKVVCLGVCPEMFRETILRM